MAYNWTSPIVADEGVVGSKDLHAVTQKLGTRNVTGKGFQYCSFHMIIGSVNFETKGFEQKLLLPYMLAIGNVGR